MKLVREELSESAMDSEAFGVKRDVLDKTAQFARSVRRGQQEEEVAVAKVKSLATSVLIERWRFAMMTYSCTSHVRCVGVVHLL